jgi:hypothetical protein
VERRPDEGSEPLHEAGSGVGRSEEEGPEGSAGTVPPSRAVLPVSTTSAPITWQDLADLPRQVLPEETYFHLRNACREAMLAAFSLWQSLDSSRQRPAGPKVRRHIDIE